jgi:hypothetical protein
VFMEDLGAPIHACKAVCWPHPCHTGIRRQLQWGVVVKAEHMAAPTKSAA